MPRKARIDAPGALHHIIVRGINRRKIFFDDSDRDDFLDRLGAILSGSKTPCFAWALLANHLHLLLRIAAAPIATAALKKVSLRSDGKWTESVAVGSESFVTETKERLGIKARGRAASERDGVFELRDPGVPYNSILSHENAVLGFQNGYLWKTFENVSV
jgi:REP element-mobilizing transposase RayT